LAIAHTQPGKAGIDEGRLTKDEGRMMDVASLSHFYDRFL
jgi:hypothetical protein